jgi:hypothetical protein
MHFMPKPPETGAHPAHKVLLALPVHKVLLAQPVLRVLPVLPVPMVFRDLREQLVLPVRKVHKGLLARAVD